MKYIPEHEAKEILENCGIKSSKTIFCESEDEAVRAAKQIGFPVVMKVASRKIVHKSDAGGVILGIESEDEVRRAFRKLIAIEDAEGVTVQETLAGIELIVGGGENEHFGSYVMFGLGGVFAEVLRDVSYRLAPLSRKDAEEMIREIRGYRLLEGYRGFRADVDSIVELLVNVSRLVEDENILELDLNPVFASESGCYVADARMVVGEGRDFSYSLEEIGFLFNPRSVAVIGASRHVGKPGYNIVWNMKQHEFTGKIYPVNPNAKEILGYKCYPSVLDIPDNVDVAIIGVPARMVPKVMRECAEKGIKGVVIVSSGFSEESEEGKELEREVLEIARSAGIRIFGPNTTGVLNTDNGFITTFALLPVVRAGRIGVIAQTGLFLGVMMEMVVSNHPSIGFSKVIGMGNKADVEDYEVLNYLLSDEKTDVVGMYIEGLRNGRAFFDVARNADKPVVVFKSGRTEYGKKAALSHTASMTGDDDIFNAAVKQANMVRVYSFDELFNVSKALSLQPLPKGKNVAVVHYTGSGCVQAADTVYLNNLNLAKLGEKTVRKIRRVTPEWHQVNNPVDIWPMVEYHGSHNAYNAVIEALMTDQNVDSLIVAIFASGFGSLGENYRPDFKWVKSYGKPVYFVIEGRRDMVFELKNEYEINGIPVYPNAITAVEVLGKVTRYALRRSSLH
ncbi:acetate--CoA ligase family protein [Geoglobus acetivorans]|uniref:acetate--CoA ligase (ADP-forming) n=1 Tax=Geoglobus acetivorans TaxID=565033 RepID=A0A0A7GAX5_GEOAI|nr:Acetyl-CoA synthetase (ADP-forming) alpha and beta chains, putative [Geoglobus acetivorans]